MPMSRYFNRPTSMPAQPVSQANQFRPPATNQYRPPVTNYRAPAPAPAPSPMFNVGAPANPRPQPAPPGSLFQPPAGQPPNLAPPAPQTPTGLLPPGPSPIGTTLPNPTQPVQQPLSVPQPAQNLGYGQMPDPSNPMASIGVQPLIGGNLFPNYTPPPQGNDATMPMEMQLALQDPMYQPMNSPATPPAPTWPGFGSQIADTGSTGIALPASPPLPDATGGMPGTGGKFTGGYNLNPTTGIYLGGISDAGTSI